MVKRNERRWKCSATFSFDMQQKEINDSIENALDGQRKMYTITLRVGREMARFSNDDNNICSRRSSNNSENNDEIK